MQYRLLGRSGLRVSVLTLGTMTFGGKGGFALVGNTDAAGAALMVDMALDAGVNLLDTSDIYSDGASEAILGSLLAGRRDSVLLATKARFPMGPGANDRGLSRHHLIRACEASLRRLGTDHIDLYQVHEWDGLTPVEETMAALDSLVRAGKVGYIGVSNFAGWQLMKALGAADRAGGVRFISQQIHYTLEAREAEYELVPISLDQGLGILVWSPLGGGLLSGKYRRNQAAPEGGRNFAEWREPPIRDENRLYDIIELLIRIGAEHGVTAAEVALAWLLRRPGVASVVIGATREEQLATNLRAASLDLSDTDMEQLNRASQPPLLYPYWHQALTARDRLNATDLAFLAPYLAD